jgi:hypothetical protein
MSNVTAGNIMVCCGQHFARELQVVEPVVERYVDGVNPWDNPLRPQCSRHTPGAHTEFFMGGGGGADCRL